MPFLSFVQHTRARKLIVESAHPGRNSHKRRSTCCARFFLQPRTTAACAWPRLCAYRAPASIKSCPPHRSMDMRYSLDAVKHHCRQRFEAIGLLHIIYLSLGDFRMLQRPGPLRGHTDERAWGLVHPSIRFDWRNGALMQCMSKPDPIMPERS